MHFDAWLLCCQYCVAGGQDFQTQRSVLEWPLVHILYWLCDVDKSFEK